MSLRLGAPIFLFIASLLVFLFAPVWSYTAMYGEQFRVAGIVGMVIGVIWFIVQLVYARRITPDANHANHVTYRNDNRF